MTKPIESFFDIPTENFTLWSPPSGTITISQEDIIFQAPLHKISKNNQWKEHYFVLTKENFFFLKSEDEPKIVAVMKTDWVRCDYIYKKNPQTNEINYCIRFVRNMRYTDLWSDDEDHFLLWRRNLCKSFLQCDFHAKFNTIKMIGKGSFARVYLVEDKNTKDRFAVKAFSKEYLLSQPKGKASLINEVDVMRKLDHPYVMKLEEVHESKNSIYLVLELLEGGELLNYISRKKNLKYKDYWRVMKCIMEALSYMDSKKIMHRDLKPDNMILKEKDNLSNCTLKLVDFGLATVYDIPEYLFKRCGTPGFVSPEVINAPSKTNIHYSPKCDVFSAGVIFYILLTEKSPFDGKSFKEILHKNKKCKINFKHPKLKKNKVALDLLIKMCEIDPVKRISAKDSLNHRFFTDLDDHEMVIEKSQENNNKIQFEAYEEQKKLLNPQLLGTNSLVIREKIIDGKTNTICDSINSQGFIQSFKSMSNPKKKSDGIKRESILKFVLLQNTKGNSDDIYCTNFVNENFDSDYEEDEYEF